MNGAGVNIDDVVPVLFKKRNFDVRILAAFLFQNLDTVIIVFVSNTLAAGAFCATTCELATKIRTINEARIKIITLQN